MCLALALHVSLNWHVPNALRSKLQQATCCHFLLTDQTLQSVLPTWRVTPCQGGQGLAQVWTARFSFRSRATYGRPGHTRNSASLRLRGRPAPTKWPSSLAGMRLARFDPMPSCRAVYPCLASVLACTTCSRAELAEHPQPMGLHMDRFQDMHADCAQL